MPVTSPIAHSRSPARSCASTGTPCGSGVDADGLQADAVDPRPPAGGDQQPVAAQLAAVVELEDVVVAVAPGGGRVGAERRARCPSRRSTSPSASPSGAGSRASRCAAPSTSTTSPPRRRTACAISTPTGPPPSTSSRRGTAFMPVASRLVQMPSSSRRPGIGGMNGSAPLASTTWSAVCATPSTSTAPVAGEPAGAAQQVDAVPCQPALLAGVGVVGDHEVAPGERRLDVDLGASPPPRARRAPPRPAAAASSTGCTPSTSTRRRPARARRSRPAGRPRPARPAQCSPGEPPPSTITS